MGWSARACRRRWIGRILQQGQRRVSRFRGWWDEARELGEDLIEAGSRVGWWTARNCNERGREPRPRRDRNHRTTTRGSGTVTYLGMGFTAAWAFWPEPHHDPNPAPLDRIASALLISNEKDPVTPISGARAVRTAIPDSRLVTVSGTQRHLVLPESMPSGLPRHDPRYQRLRHLRSHRIPCARTTPGARHHLPTGPITSHQPAQEGY
ncbi:alpha/beta hydrolase [Nocardia sp. NPDC004123]